MGDILVLKRYCLTLSVTPDVFYAVPAETTTKQIEQSFKEFTNREDIGILLITQYVSVGDR